MQKCPNCHREPAILHSLYGVMVDAIEVALKGNKKDLDLKELQPFIDQFTVLLEKAREDVYKDIQWRLYQLRANIPLTQGSSARKQAQELLDYIKSILTPSPSSVSRRRGR